MYRAYTRAPTHRVVPTAERGWRSGICTVAKVFFRLRHTLLETEGLAASQPVSKNWAQISAEFLKTA